MDGVVKEMIEIEDEVRRQLKRKNEDSEKSEMSWLMVSILGFNHIAAIYGLYLVFTAAKAATTLFAIFLYEFTILGTTAGAHRLWSHQMYKAKWPLELLLMIMFSTSHQFSVLSWARDHRSHHKFTGTDADPYNSKRSFRFSPMGWLCLKKHPDVAKRGKEIDMSDLYNNPLVRQQHENKIAVLILCCYILPTLIPMYFWNETLANSFCVAVALRSIITALIVGPINSAAHMFGNTPRDKKTWHNYHQAFPWDYAAAEFGNHWTNHTTPFIDLLASIGWAYDLKTASDDLVQKRDWQNSDESNRVWGWDDKDVTDEHRRGATILSPQNPTKLVQ